MTLYSIEWTHGDGMDQHQEFVNLTPEQANEIRTLLDERLAVEPLVYEPLETLDFSDLVWTIKHDLPLDDE